MNDVLCAIDIGSSLCHVLIGRPAENGRLEVLGVGTTPSQGVRHGAIINIDAAIQSVAQALKEAELMSGLKARTAWINVTGKHLAGTNSRGVVAIPNKDRVIQEQDVWRVIEGAQNIRIPADQEIIHVLSREFIVDDQNGIKDPTGMTGIRLEADVHIVTASTTAMTNLRKVVNGVGLHLNGVVMSSLAAAESCLTESDMELGVALVDLGGGVCDVLIYVEGGVAYSTVVPLGGSHVTQDLSIGLKLPVEDAEALKKKHGLALMRLADPTEKIELPASQGRAGRLVLQQQMAEIIEARLKEIFELVDFELVKSGRKGALAGGVVLSGGGVLIADTAELASEVLKLNAELRYPGGLTGFTERIQGPEYACVSGMLQYTRRMARGSFGNETGGSPEQGIMHRLGNWIRNNI
ncbi:MAG: cell division protein FtsA [Leptospiraceae bacterium]|nr:cell division protein FtsA [Leptospiraceae bacterium]